MRDDELLLRFLLGELTEDEAERVEKRLLEDEELFDRCEAIEADLLEVFVRGGLTPAEREQVRKRLASSPQGRARLALARNLVDVASPRRTLLLFPRLAALTARPAVRWAVAACLVALLGGTGTWTWFHNLPEVQPVDKDRPTKIVEVTPPQPVDTQVIEEPPLEQELTPPPESADEDAVTPRPEPLPREETADTKIFVVQLATLLRSGEEESLPVIEIPDGKEHVAFHVEISALTPRPFDSYSAVVRREDDDREIWIEPKSDDTSALDLTVSASELLPGRYEVQIFGHSANGDPEPLIKQEFEVTGGG